MYLGLLLCTASRDAIIIVVISDDDGSQAGAAYDAHLLSVFGRCLIAFSPFGHCQGWNLTSPSITLLQYSNFIKTGPSLYSTQPFNH